MEVFIEILVTLLPLIFVSAIVIFVIYRLKAKQRKGTLVEKKSENAQILMNSLIPLGLIFGAMLGTAASWILPFTLLTSVTMGSAIGYLFGYFAYEAYSRKEENYKH
ncbi:hypothetical protein [Planococcus sp. CAU13]|uniref:hypothetical protein n=1 Tax=Planococcus sp. CAU13 TaxID=1541197 RepID=UPI0006923B3E|nr:hypothetical protein [Planococcus sp. CAU13]